MNPDQPTTPQRPSHEQWEAVRFFISKLWCGEKETLPSIILRLRNDHDLHASPKTLKTKLQEWGLIKKMNPQDAENLFAAQARLDALGQSGLLLLRGRLEQIKRVHDYQRRRGRLNGHHSTTTESTVNSASSQVVTLSCHPRLRPEPALTLLTKFESLLREMQYLLHAAKEASMCIPGRTTLDWKTSTIETESLERSLQYSTWEGARAFQDGDLIWAGLCWQSALLTLEDLIWEPDLNIWISFIRGCVRLTRSEAKEVAQQFLWKLRWLRDELPCSAPHRALIHAITDLPLSDFVDGCLFILEVNLRNVELLWSLEKDCRIEYQLHLEEERLYQGSEELRDVPQVHDSELLLGQDLLRDTSIQRSRISACMLLSEYDKAEMIARSSISQLEQQHCSCADEQQAKKISTILALWYALLGSIQYLKADDTQSRTSYLKCLQLHQDTQRFQTEPALQPVQIHSILTFLSWLNTNSPTSEDKVTPDLDLSLYKQKLEADFHATLQSQSNAPFQQRPTQPLNLPIRTRRTNPSRTKNPIKYYDMRSVPDRPRIIQRPVFLRVDRDKPQTTALPNVTTRSRSKSKSEEITKGKGQKSTKVQKPPPARKNSKQALSTAGRQRVGTRENSKPVVPAPIQPPPPSPFRIPLAPTIPWC